MSKVSGKKKSTTCSSTTQPAASKSTTQPAASKSTTQPAKAKIVIKATPINKPTKHSKQLESFVASLGIKERVELYACNELVYLNSNILIPILLVDMKTFLAGAKTPTHYITIKSTIYINKYGMTKLIAQSMAPVAFKLQDYLYDLFYLAETTDNPEVKALDSRAELLEALSEIRLYKSIDENNKQYIAEAEDTIQTMRYDYAKLLEENHTLQESMDKLEEEREDLFEDLETLRRIARALTRYVKIKAKNPPKEAYEIDIEEESLETIDEETEMQIERDAIKAKDSFTFITKKYPSKSTSTAEVLDEFSIASKPGISEKLTEKKSVDIADLIVKPGSDPKKKAKGRKRIVRKTPTLQSASHSVSQSAPQSNTELVEYYLHRSAEPITDDKYNWEFLTEEPADDFIAMSEAFLLGDPVGHPINVFYNKVQISVEKMQTIMKIVNDSGCTENLMLQLLEN